MIKSYNTPEEYLAGTPSATESTLSHIIEGNEVKINGVFVLTTRPKKGDICVLDATRAIRYISLETYAASLLPSGWQVVGFVEWTRGSLVKVDRALGAYEWAKYFLWEVTGYTADGASHAFSFSVTVSGTAYTCSGNYTGNDIDEVAASMNAIVKPFDFGGHKYHVFVRDGKLILQHDTYTVYLAVTPTGVTVTQAVGVEIPASTGMPRKNGTRTGEGSVMNLNRALIYFRSDMASGTYNPATDVTSIARGYPICLPAYLGTSANNNDHCAFLRAYYGEGEEGWIKFMKNQQMVWPSQAGVNYEPTYGDGMKNTYLLAGQTTEDHDGNTVPLYPAFDAVAAVNFNHDDLAAGKWYFPTSGEVFELKSGITYPAVYQPGVGSVAVAAKNADPISRACDKIGMTQVGNNTTAWSCRRCHAYIAWHCSGNNGFAGYGSYYGKNQVVASVLLTLPQAD